MKIQHVVSLFFYCFLLLFILSCKKSVLVQSSAKLSDAEKASILAVMKKQEIAWNKGNLEQFMQAYYQSETETIMIGARGVRVGYTTILDAYTKGFPTKNMGTLVFDNLNYRSLVENLAFVTGRFILTYEDEKKNKQGWFSLVMKKNKDGWFITADHTSVTPKE